MDAYRSTFEHSLTGIALLDADGSLREVNPALCRMLGYSRQELLALKFTAVNHPEDLAATIEHHSVLLNGDTPYLEEERRYLRKDGSVLWGFLCLTLVRDAEGQPSYIIANLQDITLLKQTTSDLWEARDSLEQRVLERTEELEQANEELRRFAHVVSHDLRAPLVNLQGFVSELEKALALVSSATEPLLPQLRDGLRHQVLTALHEDVPDAVGFIRSATHRMAQLTSALLRLARLGRAELSLEAIDMNRMVQDLLDTLNHQIEQRGCRVTVDELPTIVGDRTALELIFGNLLSNAVNYLSSSRPGKIHVWADCAHADHREQEDEPGFVFRVRDNGRGMPPEQIERAFEMFRRVGRQSVEGEGVGLTYVRAMVRRCGGRVWCESEHGRGSTFSVALPQCSHT